MNDGFIYEKTATTAKHAAHYRQNDAPVVQVVQRVKVFCRAMGIITEDAWGYTKDGYRVKGFHLLPHSSCCAVVERGHKFTPPSCSGVAQKLSPSCHEVAPKLPKSDFKVALEVASEVASDSSQVTPNEGDNTPSTCDLVGDLACDSAALNPLSPINPLSPVNPKRKNVLKPSAHSFVSDSAYGGGQGKSEITRAIEHYRTELSHIFHQSLPATTIEDLHALFKTLSPPIGREGRFAAVRATFLAKFGAHSACTVQTQAVQS